MTPIRLRGKLAERGYPQVQHFEGDDVTIELPPLSRSPKVGDNVLVINKYLGEAEGKPWLTASDKIVAILPTEEKECNCTEGHGGTYLQALPRQDCPIHGNKAEEKVELPEKFPVAMSIPMSKPSEPYVGPFVKMLDGEGRE